MLAVQAALAVASGSLVGFTLGLIGGGGSILATPLLLYVVGLAPHQAIGTGAVAVAANAFANLAVHARAGHVRWRAGTGFAAAGILGAALGSTLGKAVDGRRLLFLFAILMIVIGIVMLRRKPPSAGQVPPASRRPRLLGAGLSVGALSGFFGIGGGFLIVPGLLFATDMKMIEAIGSSLISVGSFGATTAVNYASSGLVAWTVAAEYVAGGLIGGAAGTVLATRLAPRRAALTRIFAAIVFATAAYMLWRNAAG